MSTFPPLQTGDSSEEQQTGSNCTLTVGASADLSNASGQQNVAVSTVTLEQFKRFVAGTTQFSLLDHGDRKERKFISVDVLRKQLPHYEQYWRTAILPATNRLFDDTKIGLSPTISDEVHLLCQFNYTILSSILRAHHHMQSSHDGVYADFFASLQSSCEQVELLMLARMVVFENKETWAEVMKKTNGLRDDRVRDDLLKKVDIANDSDWLALRKESRDIALIRNALCHGPEIATYNDIDGEILAPAISMHERTLWTHLPEQSDIPALKRYFRNQSTEMKRMLVLYLKRLNKVYELISARDTVQMAEQNVFNKYFSNQP